jgi:predicted transcriptional regulator
MSKWYGTILPPTPAAPDRPKPRKHERGEMSGKPKEPLTTEQQQQATTLSAAGYSQSRVAKTIGRSRNAVKHHLEKPEIIVEVSDERQSLAVLYRDKARECVVAITPDKINRASALQLATAAGICTDKALLLAGEPTVNVAVLLEVVELIRQDRDAESERQYQQAKALRSLPANSAYGNHHHTIQQCPLTNPGSVLTVRR